MDPMCFLNTLMYLSGIWQGLLLRANTKKTHLMTRLDYVFIQITFVLGSLIYVIIRAY